MKAIPISITIILCLLFSQCQTQMQVKDIKKLITNASGNDFTESTSFKRGRELMFKKLSSDILNNDTIIILEYYHDIPSIHYSSTIYESNTQNTTKYSAKKIIKNERILIDSLSVTTGLKDYILALVIDNKLQEIKERGDNSSLTPSAHLIINILIKNKEKDKFDIQTIITKEFIAYPY